MRMLYVIYAVFMISQFIKYKLCSTDNNTNCFQVYCLVLVCVKQIFQLKQKDELYSLLYNSVNVTESGILPMDITEDEGFFVLRSEWVSNEWHSVMITSYIHGCRVFLLCKKGWKQVKVQHKNLSSQWIPCEQCATHNKAFHRSY